MCVICHKAKNDRLPTEQEIMDMWNANPDGAGIMWRRDDNRIGFKKGFMSEKSFMRYFRKNRNYFKDREVAMHFRITTHGGTSKGNCHPFVVDSDVDSHLLEGVADCVLMHNGMLETKPSKSDISDSAELAIRAGSFDNPIYYMNTIDDYLYGNKIIIMDKKGTYFFGTKFQRSEGLDFSNLNHTWKRNYLGQFSGRTYYQPGYYQSSFVSTSDEVKFVASWEVSLKVWVTKYGSVIPVDKVSYASLSEKDKEEYNRQMAAKMQKDASKASGASDDSVDCVALSDAVWDSHMSAWIDIVTGEEVQVYEVDPSMLREQDKKEYEKQMKAYNDESDYDYEYSW